MTISTQTATVTVTGDDVTTEFAYNFLIPYQDNGVTPAVQVIHIDNAEEPPVETVLTLDVDYTISGVDDPAGGLVTYDPGTPMPATEQLKISRALSFTQAQEYLNQGFLPEVLETSLDRVVMMMQQLNARITALE